MHPRLSKNDPGSYSNPEDVIISHMDLFLDVDFMVETLAGSVFLTAERKSPKADKLVLDSRDLAIKNITTSDGTKLNYSVGEPVRTFGRKLTITLPKQASDHKPVSESKPVPAHKPTPQPKPVTQPKTTPQPKPASSPKPTYAPKPAPTKKPTPGAKPTAGTKPVPGSKTTHGSKPTIDKIVIKIEYHTTPESTALHWLKPNQTIGGKMPYLFSQCQPDHCRSIIPCQDSSGVKGTYNANISVPEEFTVVMSALPSGQTKTDKNRKKTYQFSQTLPVPAYLIAIAVGNLSYQRIGPRSTVWTEPELLDQAVYEFDEIESLLKTAEDICGPYQWKIYDLLVLPPAFPFGGMENACVTFVTPTVLVGDRSLMYVIAHEIAHSWSGNLVSVKNYEHFWLNEGVSTFIERKIGGRSKGEPYRHFRAIGGLRELRNSVDTLGETNPFTQLVVNLSGSSPDDAFSKVVYEKGHTFLFYLEDLLGGSEYFEEFLRSFFDKFTHQSVDTNDFKSHLMTVYQGRDEVNSINWDEWLYSPGMPYVIPEYDNSLQIPCTMLVVRWVEWRIDRPYTFRETDLDSFMSEQIEEFLAQLLELAPLPVPKLRLMNQLYGMNSFKNSEIRVRWLRLCIRAKWLELVDLALNFAVEQGQVKYSQPIFRDLLSWEETREKAVQAFNENKSKMTQTLVDNIQKDMNLIKLTQ